MKTFGVLFLILAVVISGCTEKATPKDTVMGPSESTITTAEQKAEYIDYSAEKYQQALSEKKVVFLEFWASWCPICKAQQPEIEQAFGEIDRTDVIGFKINYDTQEDLKRQFNIVSQHTHIIIGRQGNVVYKSLEVLTAEQIKQEVLKAALQ